MRREEVVQKIKEATDIVSMAEPHLALVKSGDKFASCCPFHEERTASFYIYTKTQSYHCFGCKTSGDAIDLYKHFNGCDFRTALEGLANAAGLHDAINALNRGATGDDYYRIHDIARRYYTSMLQSNGGRYAREHLTARNISDTTAKTFSLGFAPEGWEGLKKHLESRGVKLEAALACGLLNRSEKSGRLYDVFRNRLMVPIVNKNSKTLAFGGRRLADADKAKYINTKTTPIYHKGDVLFGIDVAKQDVIAKGYAIIVEGYFDQMMLFQHGFTNTLACLGTALTRTALIDLVPLCREAVLLFDGDEAGFEASLKSLTPVFQSKIDATVIMLPEKMDPDEFIQKKGAQSFEALLAKRQGLFPFVIQHLLRRNGLSETGIKETLTTLLPALSALTDPIKKRFLLDQLATHLGIDSLTLDAFLRQRENHPKSTPRVETPVIRKNRDVSLFKKSLHRDFIQALSALDDAETLELPEVAKALEDCEDPQLKIIGNLFSQSLKNGRKPLPIEKDKLEYYGIEPLKFTKMADESARLYHERPGLAARQLRANALQIELRRLEQKKKALVNHFKEFDRNTQQYLTIQHQHVDQQKLQRELKSLTENVLVMKQKLRDVSRQHG